MAIGITGQVTAGSVGGIQMLLGIGTWAGPAAFATAGFIFVIGATALVMSLRLRRRTRSAIDQVAKSISSLVSGAPVDLDGLSGSAFERVARQIVDAQDRISEDSSRIAAIQHLNAGLIKAETIQDVCDKTDESLEPLVKPDSLTLWLPAAEDSLECVAISGRSRPEFKDFLGMRAESGSLTVSVLSAGRAVVTFDPQHDDRISEANRQITQALGIEAYLVFPLLVANRAIGVASLTWARPISLSETEVSIVELAVAHVALAIDRILHEERTSESAARNRAMLYSVGEGLVTTDSTGHVLNWNRTIAAMTTRSEEWAKGRLAFDAIELRHHDGSEVPKSANPFLTALRDRARSPEPEGGYLMACVDGWLPVTVAASPVYEGSTLYGAVAVIRDIRRERELDEMRDSLISTVSHELRTPLTMVQGFAELLSDRELSDGDRELAVAQISAAAQRLGDLIDDILSTAAIEAGRVELIPEDVRVIDAIGQACLSFPASDLNRVRTDVDGGLAVRADPDRLVQILTNLVGNALKYSPEGGQVSIDGRRDGDWIELAVSDEGIGISREDQENLFTKFFRSHEEIVRHIPGTGLGLFICRHLIELHGGTLEVESRLGSGSTFVARLPVTGPAAGENSDETAGSSASAGRS